MCSGNARDFIAHGIGFDLAVTIVACELYVCKVFGFVFFSGFASGFKSDSFELWLDAGQDGRRHVVVVVVNRDRVT